MADTDETPLSLILDAIGSTMEFWGFKHVMGRTWALLYVLDRPLSAQEICDQLRISAGTASTTLSELLGWGVVRRRVQPGRRPALYEAETDLWKMVSKVFRQRERDRVLQTAAALEEAAVRLEQEAADAEVLDADQAEELRGRAARVRRLADLSRTVLELLEAFLDAEELDIGRLVEDLEA